jgi:hypothetical protein
MITNIPNALMMPMVWLHFFRNEQNLERFRQVRIKAFYYLRVSSAISGGGILCPASGGGTANPSQTNWGLIEYLS